MFSLKGMKWGGGRDAFYWSWSLSSIWNALWYHTWIIQPFRSYRKSSSMYYVCFRGEKGLNKWITSWNPLQIFLGSHDVKTSPNLPKNILRACSNYQREDTQKQTIHPNHHVVHWPTCPCKCSCTGVAKRLTDRESYHKHAITTKKMQIILWKDTLLNILRVMAVFNGLKRGDQMSQRGVTI